MKHTASAGRIALYGATLALASALPALADPAETLLSASPFTSAPFYNGDYYTVDLALEACVLTKTTSTYDKSDRLEKQVAITIDLTRIDPARVEASGADVNLWAVEGAHVTCADLVGESCIVAERPGESIPMPAEAAADFLAGRKHAKSVQAAIQACQS